MVDSPTLGGLLARRDLRLRAITPIPRVRLDAEVPWVHSSDLADPTPFLDDGVALLTTGAQLAGSEPATTCDAYVERLAGRRVAALGFGTRIVRASVPDELVAACERVGLPLFEVPYRTPFIAVARANADAIAARGFARRSWALAAQRAISLAALRADPLPATIAELARRLDAWAGLFDPTGALAIARPSPLPDDVSGELHEAARRLLDRDVRAADQVTCAGRPFAVQTLGRGGALRGVLAIQTAGLDQEARAVVTTVVAMAGFALERAADSSRGHAALREGVLRAWLEGSADLAERVADAAWGGLPATPVRVAVVPSAAPELLAHLEVQAEQTPGALFFAPVGDETVVVMSGGSDPASGVARRFALGVGVSRPGSRDRLGVLVDEARAALPAAGAAEYAPRGSDLFRSPGEDALAAARALLDPLIRHDTASGADLRGDLDAWLAHDAAIDRAASARGVHRHTMRARIAQAGDVLGLDLSTFAGRATLWAALRTAAP